MYSNKILIGRYIRDNSIQNTVLTQLQAHTGKQMLGNNKNKVELKNKINAKSHVARWRLMAFSTQKSDYVPTE